jgi:hypothetical protein
LISLSIIIVIHFGIKPVKGGKPPRDKRVKPNIMDEFNELINI